MSDPSREAFEKWCYEHTNGHHSPLLWKVWQASWTARAKMPSALDIAKICLANYGTEPGNWMDQVSFEECAYETAQDIHAILQSKGEW